MLLLRKHMLVTEKKDPKELLYATHGSFSKYILRERCRRGLFTVLNVLYLWSIGAAPDGLRATKKAIFEGTDELSVSKSRQIAYMSLM